MFAVCVAGISQFHTGLTAGGNNRQPDVIKMNIQNIEEETPKAVNWHCFRACNYACQFCYARFEDLLGTPTMTEHVGRRLLEQLAQAGVEKINFVGGEPMLHPHIRAWIIHAKAVGMVTSIVSNGTGIDREFLEAMSEHLDWVGLSIDASNDQLHAKLGRGRKGEIKKGISGHLRRSLPVADLLHEFGVGVKLNTVVTSLNKDDDMTDIVRRIRPHRWKIFQALRIEGENEEYIGELEVVDEAFEAYVERHQKALRDLVRTQVVAENNDAMLGTYAMIDPRGFVYTNAEGTYRYSSQTMLEMGFEAAWKEVSCGFSEVAFQARDGEWDWNREAVAGDA